MLEGVEEIAWAWSRCQGIEYDFLWPLFCIIFSCRAFALLFFFSVLCAMFTLTSFLVGLVLRLQAFQPGDTGSERWGISSTGGLEILKPTGRRG